jgi:hypothetical protein
MADGDCGLEIELGEKTGKRTRHARQCEIGRARAAGKAMPRKIDGEHTMVPPQKRNEPAKRMAGCTSAMDQEHHRAVMIAQILHMPLDGARWDQTAVFPKRPASAFNIEIGGTGGRAHGPAAFCSSALTMALTALAETFGNGQYCACMERARSRVASRGRREISIRIDR